jgi:serine phosphatase RsbU (regulator of sigma subunit)/integral membrane sensor domain MASE1/anti-sigma regulatory factor (Ser/Thr protein kinase)
MRGQLTYAARIAAIAAAYVVLAEAGFTLAFSVRQVTAVWPPAGFAVAMLVLGGARLWPGIFIGALAANALTGEPLLCAFGVAAGNTVGPMLGAYCLRLAGFRPTFERVRDVLNFALFGSILAMLVTATNGVVQLGLAHLIAWTEWTHVWRLWWTGDAMGALLFAPPILTWSLYQREPFQWKRAVELTLLLAGAAAGSWLQFSMRLPLPVPLYPFIVWAALRFGARVTSTVLLGIAIVAMWGTIRGNGPFLGGSVEQRLSGLVIFGAVLSLTGLVLHAITAERRRTRSQMREAMRRFHALAETVPQIVWTAEATGTIDWVNRRWKEFAGSDPFAPGLDEWEELIRTGEPFEREVLLQRIDGVLRWFLVRAEPSRDEGGEIVRWFGTHTDIDEQRRALERSARIATTLQSAFLPQALPQHERLVFDALYLPASRDVLVGGDWYDAFGLPDRRIVVSIGDVTGHGLDAAISAGRVRQSIVAAATDADDPAAILTKVNRMLHMHEICVATALVAVIDPRCMTMCFASAGHPPPIVASPRHPAHALTYGSLPLGVDPESEYATHEEALEPDGVIVFYTDGFTEFSHDIETAETRLLEAVDACIADAAEQPAEKIRRALLADACAIDDAVLLVVRLTPEGVLHEKPRRRAWAFHSGQAYSAHSARHEVMKFVAQLAGDSGELMAAELILGEILANTVEHAPGIVNVEIDWTGEFPQLTVVDTGPGLERLFAQLPSDALDENGRGLFLVKSLARELRVETDRGYGTKISAVLPLHRVPRPAGGALLLNAKSEP